MAPYSKDFALACKQARDGLGTLCELPFAWILGDSDYNLTDIAPLLTDGLGRSTVAPLHRVAELLGTPDEPETQSLLQQSWFNLLTVGRVVPNKAVDLMMPALAKLRDSGIAGVRLHIAGGRDPRLAGYINRIDTLIAQHGLAADVVWHHSVSAAKLATLYRHCDVFWTASQHEGFCVPVIEAMAFDLPVLSTRKAALPETCGNAALFADDTSEMAYQLNQLATDDTLRSRLGAQGGRRYRETYRVELLEQRFLTEIDRAATSSTFQSATADADWFGLPATVMNQVCVGCAQGSAARHLGTMEGRRNFIDWLARVGCDHDPTTRAFFRSPAICAFARQLDVPEPAAHLTPAMRFAWHFNPIARSQFALQSNPEVASFLAWYREYGATLYDRILPSDD